MELFETDLFEETLRAVLIQRTNLDPAT